MALKKISYFCIKRLYFMQIHVIRFTFHFYKSINLSTFSFLFLFKIFGFRDTQQVLRFAYKLWLHTNYSSNTLFHISFPTKRSFQQNAQNNSQFVWRLAILVWRNVSRSWLFSDVFYLHFLKSKIKKNFFKYLLRSEMDLFSLG